MNGLHFNPEEDVSRIDLTGVGIHRRSRGNVGGLNVEPIHQRFRRADLIDAVGITRPLNFVGVDDRGAHIEDGIGVGRIRAGNILDVVRGAIAIMVR